MVRDLLYHGLQPKWEKPPVPHCDQSAWLLADNMPYACLKRGATLMTDGNRVFVQGSVCPVVLEIFQLVQSQFADRVVGRTKLTI